MRTERHIGRVFLALMVSAQLLAVQAHAEALLLPEEPLPEAPVVLENRDLSTGQETFWDCVYFGSYPSAEVVRTDWDAVDSYAVLDGDVIRDDDLYRALVTAVWQDNRVSVEGRDYIRMNAEDAVTASENREQHYRWDDPGEWHYFLKEPVRWRVLSVEDDQVLLLADRLLDCRPFHEEEEGVTWERSTIRSWLNGYGADENAAGMDFSEENFYDQAFDDAEKEAILAADCVTPDNLDYGTDSGPDTEDYVFLLSNEEVYADPVSGEYGFYAGRGYDDPAKRFTSTMYAKCRGAWWSPVDDYRGNSFWFMRTSGYTPYNVTYICDFGYVYSRGTTVTCDDAGILPAIRVDPDLADLEWAGEVSSAEILKKEKAEETENNEKDGQLPVLHDPVITENEAFPGGKAVAWDAVAFGSYPQTEILMDGNAEKGQEVNRELWQKLERADWEKDRAVIENTAYRRVDGRYFRFDPIRWRVLDVDGDTAFLMSDQGLDCLAYHPDLTDVNWKRSAVRSWLNGLGPEENLAGLDYSAEGAGFFTAAFTEEEREAVRRSAVRNSDNYYFGTDCGEDTEDAVFLLSEEEIFSSPDAVSYGFQPSDAVGDLAKRIVPTAYARCRGAWRSSLEESEGNGFWFFRSNGYTASNVVYSGELGYIYNRGIPVTCRDASIVPAMRVDLDSEQLIPDGIIETALPDSIFEDAETETEVLTEAE